MEFVHLLMHFNKTKFLIVVNKIKQKHVMKSINYRCDEPQDLTILKSNNISHRLKYCIANQAVGRTMRPFCLLSAGNQQDEKRGPIQLQLA